MRNLRYVPIILAVAVLCACSKVDRDWKQATGANTILAYESHLAGFPDSPHVVEARAAITQLEWQAADGENTIPAYEKHLARFPDSPHAIEARTAITQLEWQAAHDANSIDSLELFIETHPDAPQHKLAVTALDALRLAIRKTDVADMRKKLRAFLDGDQNNNVIARIGSQAFVPQSRQPQSNIVVRGGSQMMAIIGGAARVTYVAGDNNRIASIKEYDFAVGAPLVMTNGNTYIWRDGAFEEN